MVLISTFSDAYYAHVVGSWMCALRPTRDHLARGYGEAGANRAKNERQHARKKKEQLKGVALATLEPRGAGGETPSELESSGDDKEDEEEIIFPHSLLLENLLAPGDLFGQ
jgi:hypothetical protein